jgi:two-component system, OmpR family, phosphate regulon sensor histidine kinase PhoR
MGSPKSQPDSKQPSISRSIAPQNGTRLWTLPASILAGAVLVGIFEPLMLLIALGALIWLAMIHRGYSRSIDELTRSSNNAQSSITAAKQSMERLRSILDSADVPVIATDNNGTIVLVNKAARSILGSGRPLVGEIFDSLITQHAVCELEELARKGEAGHARLELPVGMDIRIFDVAADPIQSIRGAVCTFTDITELSRSVTLKADFAANASHELRTPIASIMGAVETLNGPARDDTEMTQKLIGMISENATRLDLMVKDLLDLSKLETPSVALAVNEVSLSELIEITTAPFAAVCERRSLHIETRIDEQISRFITDESLLNLILRNLIENATKFAREGTTITIKAEPIPLAINPDDPPPAELNLSSGIRFSVKDEGVGIPLTHQSRIFERFYQVDEARTGSSARRGTGLGLAIVKHSARILGGTIRVKSIPQQGTTMIVELPRCVDFAQ